MGWSIRIHSYKTPRVQAMQKLGGTERQRIRFMMGLLSLLGFKSVLHSGGALFMAVICYLISVIFHSNHVAIGLLELCSYQHLTKFAFEFRYKSSSLWLLVILYLSTRRILHMTTSILIKFKSIIMSLLIVAVLWILRKSNRVSNFASVLCYAFYSSTDSKSLVKNCSRLVVIYQVFKFLYLFAVYHTSPVS